jgi:hypothetical protein
MSLRAWRLVTLVLAALSLTMESAHVLELPQKLQYDAEMYSAVNTTLYRYFAIVGGIYQIGSIIAVAWLVYLLRRHAPSFRWTAIGASLLAAAFGAWLLIVAPVNAQIAEVMQTAPQTVPALWSKLRWRWELGHALGFAIQLLGFIALTWSVLVNTPRAAGD